MRARARRSIILTGGAVAVAAGVVSQPAHAAVDSVEVTNTLDDNSVGSLRWAIAQADADSDLTTITFASGVTGTITLTAGALAPQYAVNIHGPGAAMLRVDGGGQSTVFYFSGSAGGTSTIADITVSGGGGELMAGQVCVFPGSGVIGVGAHLTLDSVVVADNQGFAGGGVLLLGSDVQFLADHSTIRDNTVEGVASEVPTNGYGGGGLAFLSVDPDTCGAGGMNESIQPSHIALIDSTVSGNTGSQIGGGVSFFDYVGSTLIVDHSSVTGNSALFGGGLMVEGLYGDAHVDVVDSTISGNTAQVGNLNFNGASGGGIGGGLVSVEFQPYQDMAAANDVSGPTSVSSLTGASGSRQISERAAAPYAALDLTVANTTISGNSAATLGGGMATLVGHCDCPTETSSASVSNTIIGGNTAPNDPDVSFIASFNGQTATFDTFAADHSLIGSVDPDGTQVVGTGLVFGDPMLGALADNGGPTLTHLPSPASPAINAGDLAFAVPPADDQRHGTRVVGTALDIGAVEVVPGPADDAYGTLEDSPLVIAANIGVLANDPDGAHLTAAMASDPSHGTVALNGDGSFTYTPNNNYNGPDSFTYTARALFGDAGIATVRITVTPVNDAPVAVDDIANATDRGAAVQIDVLANDSDPDGDPLTVNAASGGAGSTSLAPGRSPARGLVAFGPTGVTYTPAAGFVGTDSFSYTISDGALTASATVTVSVAAAVTAAPPPTTPAPVDLPSTGRPTANSVQFAIGTLGAGIGLTVLGRRRRRRGLQPS